MVIVFFLAGLLVIGESEYINTLILFRNHWEVFGTIRNTIVI